MEFRIFRCVGFRQQNEACSDGSFEDFSLVLTVCSLGCSDEPMDLEELYMATGASWTVESSAICASFGCGLNDITAVTLWILECGGCNGYW